MQNKRLRVIEAWLTKQKLAPLYAKYEILKIKKILKFEVAKFMYLFENGKQPRVCDDYFHYVKVISRYNSRIVERNDFYLPSFKTKRTQQSIKFLGVKIWNEIQLTYDN